MLVRHASDCAGARASSHQETERLLLSAPGAGGRRLRRVSRDRAPEALARLVGLKMTLRHLALWMRSSRCGKKAAEVVEVARSSFVIADSAPDQTKPAR